MKHSEYSAVIVGSGAAGLYAALKISSQISLPDGILLITKSELGNSNSMYAQGGIVGVLHQNPFDSVNSHVADTLNSGAGLTEEKVANYISAESDNVINDLISYGVNFDKDSNGNINYTLEAAHSFRRILHVGGDSTGKGIVEALKKRVLEDSNIIVSENSMAVEILINEQKEAKGILYYNALTNEHEIAYASAIILATGGVGQLYSYTTNPEGATGDGIDLAYNCGAEIQDMEFIQFHPTALAVDSGRFLISEAVRGEGAVLVNNQGVEFMKSYHDKRELAPRDIVTRAIYNEMKKNNSKNMFLNASIIDRAKLMMRFPTIIGKCKEKGFDLTKSPIPVAPAAHYCMGGIKATVEGKTNIKGLYAIGEVASTGFHGANRLASNSLLECVVCAYELADYLSFTNLIPPKLIDKNILDTINLYTLPINDITYDIPELKNKLRNIMWDKVGIIRDGQGLLKALEEITLLKNNFQRNRKCLNKDEYEYRNMLTTAELIVRSAISRKESRGAHSRSDCPNKNEIANHTVFLGKK